MRSNAWTERELPANKSQQKNPSCPRGLTIAWLWFRAQPHSKWHLGPFPRDRPSSFVWFLAMSFSLVISGDFVDWKREPVAHICWPCCVAVTRGFPLCSCVSNAGSNNNSKDTDTDSDSDSLQIRIQIHSARHSVWPCSQSVSAVLLFLFIVWIEKCSAIPRSVFHTKYSKIQNGFWIFYCIQLTKKKKHHNRNVYMPRFWLESTLRPRNALLKR